MNGILVSCFAQPLQIWPLISKISSQKILLSMSMQLELLPQELLGYRQREDNVRHNSCKSWSGRAQCKVWNLQVRTRRWAALSLSNLIFTILILTWLLLKHWAFMSSVSMSMIMTMIIEGLFFLLHISLTMLRNIFCVVELHQLPGWRAIQLHLAAQVWFWWII